MPPLYSGYESHSAFGTGSLHEPNRHNLCHNRIKLNPGQKLMLGPNMPRFIILQTNLVLWLGMCVGREMLNLERNTEGMTSVSSVIFCTDNQITCCPSLGSNSLFFCLCCCLGWQEVWKQSLEGSKEGSRMGYSANGIAFLNLLFQQFDLSKENSKDKLGGDI